MMKVCCKLVQWLFELDPTFYLGFVVIEKVFQLVYLSILQEMYGMLEESLLWYRKFRNDLESESFNFNKYDPGVANRTRFDNQHTITFHVDDAISSHVDQRVNNEFGKYANQKYGELKPV